MRFVITGCGRSGTNYIANRLLASGVNCGHEQVFSVTGPLDNFDQFDGDSSWFAAPFIDSVSPRLTVLHIVRDPRSVIESFHRIGLFRYSRWRHFSRGADVLSTILKFNFRVPKIRKRLHKINAHRKLLADHTTCWQEPDEFRRLCEYWYQWNRLVEQRAHRAGLPYLRIRLEEVDDHWPDIANFLELDREITPGAPTHEKKVYRPIEKFEQELPDKVAELAKTYGYVD